MSLSSEVVQLIPTFDVMPIAVLVTDCDGSICWVNRSFTQLTGFRRDVPEIMAALDVLVLPSIKSEASSQVIPQALAVGTPVVATTVGGSPELIRDGVTGRLVPPSDAPALAAAILALLRNPDDAAAMAERGGEMVRARYTLDAAMERTVAVYDTLLTARSPRAA